MLDRGRVLKVEKDLAWVEFAKSSQCVRCGACRTGDSSKMINEAENPIGAKIGDQVEVEISPAVTTLFPLIVFGIPIILLFIGMVLGNLISEKAGIVLGLVFLASAFAAVRLIDGYVTGQKKFRSRIVRILFT